MLTLEDVETVTRPRRGTSSNHRQHTAAFTWLQAHARTTTPKKTSAEDTETRRRRTKACWRGGGEAHVSGGGCIGGGGHMMVYVCVWGGGERGVQVSRQEGRAVSSVEAPMEGEGSIK